ncbi:MAG: oxygenase MpaB family protein [Microbacteriaceae bacterium]
MNSLLEPLRARLQETLSGQPSGTPAWIGQLEQGTDAGFFGPASATWVVHGAIPTLVAGMRALLMQALHPGALAGVHDWSDYRADPLRRLASTIRWIHMVTYGDTAHAVAGSERVLKLHERVVGDYRDAHGRQRRYAANDPELSTWVHLAFTDAFLTAQKLWGKPIPGGSDQYVREWAKAGELMNVPNPPTSTAELKAQLHGFADAGELIGGPMVQEIVDFIRRAPVSRSLRPAYRILFAGAVASLEPRFRTLLGLRTARLGPVPLPVIGATGLTLAAAGRLLGPQSAGERAARVRLARLG